MIILDYTPRFHKEIIKIAAKALRGGKLVIYPTDTTYGLACDITQIAAVKKLYATKGRNFKKPVHVVVPSISAAKKLVAWNAQAERIAKALWPGAITLVLPLRAKGKNFIMLSAKLGTLGLRQPNNRIALDLVKQLGRPISATSSNLSGGGDCYTLNDILKQFSGKTLKPDIIINMGRLPKRKPSTVVLLDGKKVEILRPGPINKKQILSHVL